MNPLFNGVKANGLAGISHALHELSTPIATACLMWHLSRMTDGNRCGQADDVVFDIAVVVVVVVRGCWRSVNGFVTTGVADNRWRHR